MMEYTTLNYMYTNIPGAPKRTTAADYAGEDADFDDFLPFMPIDRPLCARPESHTPHHAQPARNVQPIPAADNTLDKRSLHSIRLRWYAYCRQHSLEKDEASLDAFLTSYDPSTITTIKSSLL